MEELKKYFWNEDGYQLDLDRENDGTPLEQIGRYEIVFDIDKDRYYCFIDATNINEALGIFFINHPHITYEMILDQMEV
jgi:hypothetical protein